MRSFAATSKSISFWTVPMLAAVVLGVSGPAFAETISLQCTVNYGTEVMFISIDTQASTAKSWISGFNSSQVPPQPAVISDNAVKWEDNEGNAWHEVMTLDRNTGALTQDMNGQNIHQSWICHPTTKLF